jgi:hypothetical protein
LKQPLLNRDLLWSICHPDLLHGESGYYLTVYESALEFIAHDGDPDSNVDSSVQLLNEADVSIEEPIDLSTVNAIHSQPMSINYVVDNETDYAILNSDFRNSNNSSGLLSAFRVGF